MRDLAIGSAVRRLKGGFKFQVGHCRDGDNYFARIRVCTAADSNVRRTPLPGSSFSLVHSTQKLKSKTTPQSKRLATNSSFPTSSTKYRARQV